MDLQPYGHSVIWHTKAQNILTQSIKTTFRHVIGKIKILIELFSVTLSYCYMQ